MAAMSRPVFRFAPSPNGYLHLGHAYSALLNHDRARATGGRFLLRIEDIDTARCRPEFEAAIYEDLAWLGLGWEEPVRRQSDHLALYRRTLERLESDGLVYPAFESRADIARMIRQRDAGGGWPHDPDGAPLYPGTPRDVSESERETLRASGQPFALRLDMAAATALTGDLTWHETGRGPAGETGQIAARPQDWGDVIVGRKETPASYHLSVVLDDAEQGVTCVMRGHDLFRSTDVHRVLQALLGLPAPDYCHHDLIRDEAGDKLSKSTRSTSLRELRMGGATAAQIRHLVGLA
jgi:glutamyl-Q tRNA(Asp) synthetase